MKVEVLCAEQSIANLNSCPDEAKCLCDVYGVGDCSLGLI